MSDEELFIGHRTAVNDEQILLPTPVHDGKFRPALQFPPQREKGSTGHLKGVALDAEVLDDDKPVELEEDEKEYDDVAGGQTPELDDLAKNDLARQGAEHAQRLIDEAEADKAAQLKAQRVANLEKARQAKAAKKENKDDA